MYRPLSTLISTRPTSQSFAVMLELPGAPREIVVKLSRDNAIALFAARGALQSARASGQFA